MGHGKLKKFAENETFRCLLQPAAEEVMSHGPGGELLLKDHPVKGRWNRDMFAADQPIVLELGCGKGEYTIALAERHPEMNFIGVDIKGARLWKGAKYATEKSLPNVAFLRTRIEFIPAFFGPGEVSEIWLTFSDPQLKSPNSRLTSPLFLDRYRSFLTPGGIVHLKTDSRFLHEYTKAVIATNALPVLASGTDIYHDGLTVACASGEILLPGGRASYPGPMATLGHVRGSGPEIRDRLEGTCSRKEGRGTPGGVAQRRSGEDPFPPEESPLKDLAAVFEVQTFYESMFLEMGLPITYLAFTLDRPTPAETPSSHAPAPGDPPVTGKAPAPGETPVPGEVPAPVRPSGPRPFAAPADFDEKFWREAEGPRRTFSHQRTKQ